MKKSWEKMTKLKESNNEKIYLLLSRGKSKVEFMIIDFY